MPDFIKRKSGNFFILFLCQSKIDQYRRAQKDAVNAEGGKAVFFHKVHQKSNHEKRSDESGKTAHQKNEDFGSGKGKSKA